MRIPRTIRRWFGVTEPPTAKAPLPFTRLTLADWRSSPERVAYASELLRQPLFLDLLGMLSNIRPAVPAGLDATTAALLLGQRTGHDQVIGALLSAATPFDTRPPASIEADYAPENVMAAWDGAVEEESQ